MSCQAGPKTNPARPQQSTPDISETSDHMTLPMDTEETRHLPDAETQYVGTSSPGRSPRCPPTLAVRPAGQLKPVSLLTVRAGVPVSDALELASAMLVSACATTRLVAMDYRGEQSGSLWSTVYLLEVVVTLVEETRQAQEVYS